VLVLFMKVIYQVYYSDGSDDIIYVLSLMKKGSDIQVILRLSSRHSKKFSVGITNERDL
jgi:hypothetical protein